MSTKPFEYGDVRVMLVSPSNETLMDMARYQVRLTVGQERATPASMSGVIEFAAIMAHVRDVMNFPCEIPDPKSSSEGSMEVMAVGSDPGSHSQHRAGLMTHIGQQLIVAYSAGIKNGLKGRLNWF